MEKNFPKVAVIILNWNTRDYLEKFLPMVINSDYPNLEVIVADNGSRDGSVELVRDKFKNVKLITFDKNYGFAGGYNRAVSQVDAEFIILLNTDVEVGQGWLTPLVKFMTENPDVAGCQPKILSYFERNKFEYAGASGGFIDRFGYPFCRGRIFETCEEDIGQYDDIKQIFWASGACMMLRKKVIDEIGFLDEDFFAHMEEIDWCWRAQLCGYKFFCVPESVVYHIGGGTLPKANPWKTFLNYRNSLIMLEKNLPLSQLLYILPARLMLDIVSALVFLAKLNFKDFFAIIKAHLAFFIGQPKWLKKRFQTRKNLKFKSVNNGVVYRGSIVFDYFIKGKKFFSQLKF